MMMMSTNWLFALFTIGIVLTTLLWADDVCGALPAAAPATFLNKPAIVRTPIATKSSYSSSQRKQRDGDSGSERSSGGGDLLPANALNYNERRRQISLAHHHNTNTSGELSSLSLVLRDSVRADICEHHCNCTAKNAFLVVDCNFNTNRKLSESFDESLQLPIRTIALTIHLAPKTALRLKNGFFNGNTVNSLSIIGNDAGEEQLEIETLAFAGNQGPQLEMLFQNVSVIFVREHAFAGDGKITVRNSKMVKLFENAFQGALIYGTFAEIADLRIEEKAFNSAQTKLRFESSHIPDLYRFEASLHEIQFLDCTLGTINSGTFDVNNINSIIFDGCTIDTIKMRAITEKLYSKHVSITHAKIGRIESEAIFGSGIATLILTDNSIDTIQAHAIYVTAINATISRNNIKHLERDWMHVDEWSHIAVDNNRFGTFGRILLGQTKRPIHCTFDGNSITEPEAGSLNIMHPKCMLREIAINRNCRCTTDWLTELSVHDLRSEIYCNVDEKLAACFNASSFNTLRYVNEVCDEHKTTLNCQANMNLKKIKGKFYTDEELRHPNLNIPNIFLYIAIACLFCIIMISVIVYIVRLAHKHAAAATDLCKYGHHISDEQNAVIDNAMHLMQSKFPANYAKFEKNVRQLRANHLSSNNCIKVVRNLIGLLPDDPNEFTAFRNMLVRHMELHNSEQMPAAPANDDGCCYMTSSTIVYQSGRNPEVAIDTSEAQLTEHIYAEPNCPQEPLLHNEYASPADRNNDLDDGYMEPFNGLAIAEMRVALPPSPECTIPLRIMYSSESAEPVSKSNLPDVLQKPGASNNNNNGEFTQNPVGDITAPQSQNRPKSHLQAHATGSPLQAPPPPHYYPDNERRLPFPIYSFITASKGQQHTDDPTTFAIMEDGDGGGNISNDMGSNHSGGSHETVQIDDIIDYADA